MHLEYLIMKALILAAGKGTRLKPVTDKICKPLLPLRGKPTILYILNELEKINIKEVGIVVSQENHDVHFSSKLHVLGYIIVFVRRLRHNIYFHVDCNLLFEDVYILQIIQHLFYSMPRLHD